MSLAMYLTFSAVGGLLIGLLFATVILVPMSLIVDVENVYGRGLVLLCVVFTEAVWLRQTLKEHRWSR